MENTEEIKQLVFKISDINEIITGFLQAKNIADTNCIFTVLKQNQKYINRLVEILDGTDK